MMVRRLRPRGTCRAAALPCIAMSEVISAIDPLPSDPNVLRVRVGGRLAARLQRPDVERLGLGAGQAWTAEVAEAVQQAVELGKARKAALAALGRRALSRGELTLRLEAKGHEAEIIAMVLDELETDGWLDDRAYARSVAHELTRRKPASRRLLMQRLQARQIDVEVAAMVADEVAEADEPTAEAERFARERLRSMGSLPPATAARRIAGALARRGFDAETIEAVLSELELFREHSEHE